ncbi:cell division protein FtsA [Candidatus Dependentiae bacterium]|nr:cell division protein FtsA [Candidatus Dependentiae bacterium]
MARVLADRIITSIDIGTTKISVLIAQQLDGKRVEILGIGKAPSYGLRKGVVVDVADTIRSIKTAVQEAELMAGIQVESAYIGISGAHISSMNSQGMIPLKYGQVRPYDIKQVIETAKAIPVSEGQKILHVLPQYFIIDDQDPVYNPCNLHGVRLQVQAHIIMGSVSCVQNLITCCEAAGISVKDIVLEQLASADAVLSNDEKELGVAMIDIGGGTADLALYQRGNIRHTMVLPVAGQHFTNDLAIGMRISRAEAERIKKEYGCVISPFDTALARVNKNNEEIIVESIDVADTQHINQYDIARVLYPRANELLAIVRREIIQKKLQKFMTAGLVLTGGGSLLNGMKELAQEIFDVPVRIGIPRIEYDLPQSLESPIYATGYGLLIHVLKKYADNRINNIDGPLVQRIFMQMKSWVSDFF